MQSSTQSSFATSVTYLQHWIKANKVERRATAYVYSNQGRAGFLPSTCSTRIPRQVRGFFYPPGVTTQLPLFRVPPTGCGWPKSSEMRFFQKPHAQGSEAIGMNPRTRFALDGSGTRRGDAADVREPTGRRPCTPRVPKIVLAAIFFELGADSGRP